MSLNLLNNNANFELKGNRQMILKRLSLVLALVVLVGLVLPCFAETVTYEYDDLYRLKKATYSDGTVIEYTYDAAGNRQSVIKIPPAQTPTVSISADPLSIEYGMSSTLTWVSTNATTCSIDQGIGAVNASGSTLVSPLATTTYTITATGAGGTATASATITVGPPPAPTVSISANPGTILSGESSNLTWTSTNADSCSIDQGIGAVAANGSTTVSPTETSTYTITATGPGGTASASATITVTPPTPPPTVSITADPVSIRYGQSATLMWSSTNATSCDIEPGIGAVGPSGSISVSPTVTTSYTITAIGAGGMATASVTITVAPPPAPTVHISAYPRRIRQGQSATLRWRSRNAETCDIQPGIGAVGTSGSMSVSPTATSTYTITAFGPGGVASDSVRIIVIPPRPTVSLSADPVSIRKGEPSTLSWQSTNADSAFIRPGTGEVPASGSITVSPRRTTQYTITVTGPGGRARDSITIRVRLR